LSKSTKTNVSTLEKFDDVVAYLDSADYSVVSQPSWFTLPSEFNTADTIVYFRSNINGGDYKVVIGHKDPEAPVNAPAAVKCDKWYHKIKQGKNWVWVCQDKGSSCYIETMVYQDPFSGSFSTIEEIKTDCK